MSQNEHLLRILYRTEKSAVAMLEKELAGTTMEPQVARVYERKKEMVAELEQKLKGGSS